MTDEANPSSTLHRVKNGLMTLCLVSMVAGFVALGALGYQGWKLFHNPYLAQAQRAQAPSPEAADWAAGVYRREKRDHLVYSSLLEVGLVALATGSWFLYRALDKHLQRVRTVKPQERRG